MNKIIFNISTFYKFALSLVIVWSLGSCSKEQEEPESVKRNREDVAALQNYLETNQIEATKGTNDYFYYVIQESTDPEAIAPALGNIVEIYYKIFLLDGTEVASYTSENGAPIKIKHASDAVFPFGIDFALQHIKKGETHRVLLPSALAYYDYSNATLPQYANLIVELELVDILTDTKQREIENTVIEQYIAENELGNFTRLPSGLHYKVLEEGSGSTPLRGNRVSVAYEGSLLNGTVFDESKEGTPFVFVLGNNTVIQGWEQGIPLMQKGETAKLIIPSHLAYNETFTLLPQSFKDDMIDKGFIGGQKINLSRTIPPFSVLVFNVTLENIN